MKKPIIIWTEVWDEYEAWREHFQFRCESCDHYSEIPTIDDERSRIEELVEKQLERKR